MTETLQDVEKWLNVGIKAWFPFDQEAIDTLSDSLDYLNDRGDVEKRVLEVINRLKNRLDLFKINNDGEYVTIGEFSISRVDYAGPNSVPTPDGSLDNERIQGFLLEGSKQIYGTYDTPPDVDVFEIEKFASAARVAQKVIELLFLGNLSNAFTAQAEFEAYEEEKREYDLF